MDSYCYLFPAVKGIQAKSDYYICMVPLGLLLKLFPFESEAVEPEYRAQRKLNVSRIPEIKNYILSNRESYIFSALCASFDGDYVFETNGNGNLGFLKISMDASFLINDGQHRRAAIVEAIDEDPTLKQETIPVVMFLDKGLSRSQQMFTDLNKHAVNTTKSLNALYDSSDQLSVMTKNMVNAIPFLKKYTDKEKDNLGKFSSNLFTLNNLVTANKYVVKGLDLNDEIEKYLIFYWNNVFENIYEFRELENKEMSKVELREKYIITQGVTINALGMLGNYLFKNQIDFSVLHLLKDIDWRRNNNDHWLGKAINKRGKIVKNTLSIMLTFIEIKKLLNIEISKEEKELLRQSKNK